MNAQSHLQRHLWVVVATVDVTLVRSPGARRRRPCHPARRSTTVSLERTSPSIGNCILQDRNGRPCSNIGHLVSSLPAQAFRTPRLGGRRTVDQSTALMNECGSPSMIGLPHFNVTSERHPSCSSRHFLPPMEDWAVMADGTTATPCHQCKRAFRRKVVHSRTCIACRDCPPRTPPSSSLAEPGLPSA